MTGCTESPANSEASADARDSARLEDLLIVCLCADWCLTCKAFERDFEQFAASADGAAVRWLDIEDEAEVMGDVDVETFPTVLIATHDRVAFFGPILPNREHLAQLVSRAGGLRVADPEIGALAARVREHFAR